MGTPLVALVGRTKAGKSTFRHALTGTGEEEIGRGDQRTTRRIIEWCAGQVDYIDTPGVGAFRGSDDTALTRLAASTADLLVWVVSNDPPQPQTLDDVATIARDGAPMLVVVNHKRALLPEDLSADAPPQLLTHRDEHVAHLTEKLAARGVTPRAVLHAHFDAARLRWGGQDASNVWADASNLGAVAAALELEAHRCLDDADLMDARSRRVADLLGETRRSTLEYLDAHARLTELLSARVDRAYTDAARSISDFAQQRVSEKCDRLETDLEAALTAARNVGSPKKAAESFLTSWIQRFADLRDIPATVRKHARRQLPGTTLHLESMPPAPGLSVELKGNPSLGRGLDIAKYGVELAILVAAFLPTGGGAAPAAGMAAAGGRAFAKKAGVKLVKIGVRSAARGVATRKLPSHRRETDKRMESEDALRDAISRAVANYRETASHQLTRDIERSLASYHDAALASFSRHGENMRLRSHIIQPSALAVPVAHG
nr:hypothetical protein DA06_11040 [Georgenia sp. SUBG003]